MDFSNGWLVKQRRIRVVFPLLGPKDFKFACSSPTPPPCHEDGCRVVKDNICQMMRLHSCKKGSITFTWPTTRRPCRRHSTITRLSIMVQFHPIPVQSCTLSFRTANTTSSDRLLLLHVHPSISRPWDGREWDTGQHNSSPPSRRRLVLQGNKAKKGCVACCCGKKRAFPLRQQSLLSYGPWPNLISIIECVPPPPVFT